jgi:transcriptional regulator with XRE-family HTH domain
MALLRSKVSKPIDVRKRIIESRPGVRKLWGESQAKRALALGLVRLRTRTGLSQAALAERAGWQKSYVSRLESAGDFYPDTDTIRRYVEACGGAVSVVFTDPDSVGVHVIDAVTLTPAEAHPFEEFRDHDVVIGYTETEKEP